MQVCQGQRGKTLSGLVKLSNLCRKVLDSGQHERLGNKAEETLVKCLHFTLDKQANHEDDGATIG